MSFLLLKSKSRSSRSTSYRSRQPSKQQSNGNPNNNDRNPSIAMRSHHQSTSSNSRRFANMKEIHAGDGQVQLQRPRQVVQEQSRQSNVQSHKQQQQQQQQQQKQVQQQVHRSIQQNQQQNQQQQNDNIISMDEVMEDLKVLEQQQRDSQRLLASIKLTKQHKLEQRVSLETKLSTLKYSNGEARAQLHQARDVLSKSTRELGAAKLQSERSSDNLKRFDDKLRRTLGHVRGLHSKRRQVEQAMGKLRNANTVLAQRERAIMEQTKCKEMERDDAKHREKLLIKSIQSSKKKMQEFVEDTMRTRSDLSELESELTIAQQMEASTKFRVDALKGECKTEQKRHEEAKAVILLRIKEVNLEKMEVEKKIVDKNRDTELQLHTLNEAFHRCVSLQKEDGFDLSTSPKTAAIDIDRIRTLTQDEESNLRLIQEEEHLSLQKIQTIEKQIEELRVTNQQIDDESSNMHDDVIKLKEKEEVRRIDNESFVAECKKEQEELNELQKSVNRFQEEQDTSKLHSLQNETEQKSLLDGARENIQKVEHDIMNLDDLYKAKKMELEKELNANKENIDLVQKRLTAKRVEFDSVQKLADNLKATSFDTCGEITTIATEGAEEINSLTEERAKLFDSFPCLSSLEILFDTRKGREKQIELALTDLRDACAIRINAAKEEKERTLQEERDRLKREAEDRARIEEEERLRREEEARLKAEEEERKRLELEAEEEERLRAEALARFKAKKRTEAEQRKRLEFETELEAEAEEHLRAKTLAKVKKVESEERAKLKSKAEAEEKRHRAEKLAKLKDKKKAEAEERSRNKRLIEEKLLQKAKEDQRKRNRKRIEEKAKKKDNAAGREARSNVDHKSNKESKSKSEEHILRKVRKHPSDGSTLVYDKTSPSVHKHVSKKSSRSRIDSDEKIRQKSDDTLGPSERDTSRPSTRNNNTKSTKSKVLSSAREEVKKNRSYEEKQLDKSATMKRMRSTSIETKQEKEKLERSSQSSKRRRKISVQKLDIFSQSEPIESKSTRISSNASVAKNNTSGSKSRKESSSKRLSAKSRKPSQSQATVTSRKSSSTTRRRKKVGSTTMGKSSRSSQSTSADLDFSFM